MVRVLRTTAMSCMIACMVAAVAGCGTAADAGRSFNGGELIRDIATRLAQADSLQYTADFALSDNTTVEIAHALNPDRTAYRFSGGVVLLLPDRTTYCRTSTSTCTDSTRVSPGTDTSPSVDEMVERSGLIRPETVISLLNQIAVNADAIVADNDRTLAGSNATCISVTGVPADEQLKACVTADGLLGTFDGTVGGVHLDLELVRYRLTTDPNAFQAPKA
jgi:hypothetical protein